MCATFIFIPLYGNVYWLLVSILFYGIGSGAWDSSTAPWLVEMWPRYKGTVLQLANGMYGLGTVVSPLLISPFAFGNVTATANSTAADFDFSFGNYTFNNYTDPVIDLNPSIAKRKASLMIPFSMATGLQAIGMWIVSNNLHKLTSLL